MRALALGRGRLSALLLTRRVLGPFWQCVRIVYVSVGIPRAPVFVGLLVIRAWLGLGATMLSQIVRPRDVVRGRTVVA
jgi:hypothetical protein